MIDCKSLAEVRENIDRLDCRIVELLAERTLFVEQAGKLKASKSQVVDRERIEAVIRKVRHEAMECGMDAGLVENIYRSMIDAFIIYESQIWRRFHEGA
ncbi:MAG: chorismate mutase [Magnetospirillum sp.]|nr:chorismate mutase [Magnetospirillum sp.]